jgi:hypothetical protein
VTTSPIARVPASFAARARVSSGVAVWNVTAAD